MKKRIVITFLGLMIMASLNGCQQKKGPQIQVQIKDGMTTTVLETDAGQIVEKLLEEAELTVSEKDEISPGMLELVMEDGAEIDISRYAEASVIYDEGEPVKVALCGATVQEAIDASKVSVGKNDYIDTDTERLLEDGMVISITKRAKVTLDDGGTVSKEITAAKTVQEYLDEKGVTLSKLDKLKNKPDDLLEDGTKIVIQRITQKKVYETEAIAYSTTYENSSSMYTGQTSKKRDGQNGEKKITYRVTYINGKEHDRKQIKEEITKEPVNEIIVQGTKQKPKPAAPTKRVVSRQRIYDCDGSGHGTLVITYSDGSTSTSRF